MSAFIIFIAAHQPNQSAPHRTVVPAIMTRCFRRFLAPSRSVSVDRTQDKRSRREIRGTLGRVVIKASIWNSLTSHPLSAERIFPGRINYSFRAFNHDFFIGPDVFVCVSRRMLTFHIWVWISIIPRVVQAKLKSVEGEICLCQHPLPFAMMN